MTSHLRQQIPANHESQTFESSAGRAEHRTASQTLSCLQQRERCRGTKEPEGLICFTRLQASNSWHRSSCCLQQSSPCSGLSLEEALKVLRRCLASCEQSIRGPHVAAWKEDRTRYLVSRLATPHTGLLKQLHALDSSVDQKASNCARRIPREIEHSAPARDSGSLQPGVSVLAARPSEEGSA